ncbi:hypothetical protein BU14_0033s0025 [Porphyra umbilicalis]|uniref:T-complex protein 1 subunit gamma n=1 Tax=Porphyra umbilicalis TaxID=2786 RepID=A0A1X6PII4_PORUM|nr:hypothetical protein BU14_0033s0025 [Porphyra umbilicalis]|eukprot:OSX80681.1 hypothetical protein BU14_0033s0025 [Porphyra umbilicalis]
MQAPVVVLNTNAKRESGRRAQLTNIAAGKAVSDIIRTTLGPRAMLKMILDASGSLTLTNDGNAILREVDVSHPAAKSIIELSRTQDEEVGDGTTTVAVMAGELLSVAEPFLKANMHPTVVVRAYFAALDEAVQHAEKIAVALNADDTEKMGAIVASCIGTKYMHRHSDMLVRIALSAVKTVRDEVDGRIVIDTKTYVKVEKLPGGELEDSRVLDGVMLAKDVTAANMRRRIEKPRVLLVDCPLEYRKAESATNVELTKDSDFRALLAAEEDYVTRIVGDLLAHKPDLLITEKGVSDLALHLLAKANVSVIRRVRKTDNNRVARAVGATIVSRTSEIVDADVGTGAGLFEVTKIGDDYFTFITGCDNPRACTVLLRGGSKDVLNEVERNLQDALCVARNILLHPKMVPGGGAIEMAVAAHLTAKSKTLTDVSAAPYRAVASALEVVPRTLAENCGAKVIRVLTALRAKHAGGGGEDAVFWGIDGRSGVVVDMRTLGVWEPLIVKTQTMKTAVEAAAMLLRIDDIVSGLSKPKGSGDGVGGGGFEED